MARKTLGGKIGTLGLLVGLASQVVSAQSMGMPASDPVGIGRSGTGVAFGTSLEAASLNPALLVTLRQARSAYLGAGLEVQKATFAPEAGGDKASTSDRNRLLPSLGVAWRPADAFAVGLKVDQPYLRHREIPFSSDARFLGRAIDLGTRRVEVQGAWAITPHWSIGLGAGITQVEYASEVCVATSAPSSAEYALRQSGKANAVSATFGFRWAINPRWTLGGTYQSPIKASPTWTASSTGDASAVAQAGSGKVTLPGRASLGVRQRVNQLFTWEVDLRYIQGSGMKLPSQPSLATSGGTIEASALDDNYRDGFGFSAMGEFTWGKKWSSRVGFELLPALVKGADSNPLVGGAKSAGFSAGVGYKALGGEFSFGYQLRQSIDQTIGGALRNEASGHLLAIGYKRAF